MRLAINGTSLSFDHAPGPPHLCRHGIENVIQKYLTYIAGGRYYFGTVKDLAQYYTNLHLSMYVSNSDDLSSIDSRNDIKYGIHTD